MTLGRLVLAWAPVAVWFAAVAAATERWRRDARLGGRLGRAAAEAAALTLLASLWFDSLGHGGWWLIFLLVGALAGFPGRLREAEAAAAPAGRAWRLGLLDAARYVAAGGMLAWRLG